MNEHYQTANSIRKIILQQSKRANVGHIGSGLSVADIMAALYFRAMHIVSPNDKNRDRFVLSKGHAALALYAAFHLRGWLCETQLNTFCGNNTLLGVHPEHQLPGVEFATGSLGMGLSYGAGCALSAKMRHEQWRTFVLMSDAEYNEGSVWETAMFAGQHKLSNLVAIVDSNQQQALGYTKDILNSSQQITRWQAFGWQTHEVNGNDEIAIANLIAGLNDQSGRPHAIIAHTTFGYGVSFMQNLIKWHYMPMNDTEFQIAMSDVNALGS